MVEFENVDVIIDDGRLALAIRIMARRLRYTRQAIAWMYCRNTSLALLI